jgi:hypothetical protein
MNKSLDFLLKRIASGKYKSDFTSDEWSKCEVIPFEDFIRKYSKSDDFPNQIRHGKNGKFVYNGHCSCVKYDSNADFEYVHTVTCSHDGTLLFYIGAIERCINDILCGATIDSRKDPLEKYQLDKFPPFQYTVGDILCAESANVLPPNEEMKFPYMTTSISIPIKFDLL